MARRNIDIDNKNTGQPQKGENLKPVENVFTFEAEENMTNFEDDLVTDSDETRSPGDQIADEYGENLKSNIEQNLEREQ